MNTKNNSEINTNQIIISNRKKFYNSKEFSLYNNWLNIGEHLPNREVVINNKNYKYIEECIVYKNKTLVYVQPEKESLDLSLYIKVDDYALDDWLANHPLSNINCPERLAKLGTINAPIDTITYSSSLKHIGHLRYANTVRINESNLKLFKYNSLFDNRNFEFSHINNIYIKSKDKFNNKKLIKLIGKRYNTLVDNIYIVNGSLNSDLNLLFSYRLPLGQYSKMVKSYTNIYNYYEY